MRSFVRLNLKQLLVVIMLAISTFMFMYYRDAEETERREMRDADAMRYRNELVLNVFGEGFTTDAFSELVLDECTLSIVDLSMYLDGAGVLYMTDVIISGEDYLIPIWKGAYPSSERLATGEPCAVLGKELYQYTYKKDGRRYIQVHGDEYEVTGYAAAANSAIFDHRVILFSGCLGDGAIEDINYYRGARGLVIFACSNSNILTVTDIEEKLQNVIENEIYGIIVANRYNRFVETKVVSQEYLRYASVIYVFSVVTVIFIVQLWMLERRREYAVKKAFGYSVGRLLLEMAEELISMMGIAIVCAEAFNLLMKLLERKLIVFSEQELITKLISLSWYIICTVPVLLVVPAVILLKKNPMKILTDRDV